MKPEIGNIGREYQIALSTADGRLLLYGQQLVGDGYDEYGIPFDLYVFDRTEDGSLGIVDQDVVDGSGFCFEDGTIDWQGIIGQSYADGLLDGLGTFASAWDEVDAYSAGDTEDIVDMLMENGLL